MFTHTHTHTPIHTHKRVRACVRSRCWPQHTPAYFQTAADRQNPHAKQSGRSTSSAPRAAAAAIHRSAACTRHGAGGSQRQGGAERNWMARRATCRLVSSSPSTLAICTAATHSFRCALSWVPVSAMLRATRPLPAAPRSTAETQRRFIRRIRTT